MKAKDSLAGPGLHPNFLSQRLSVQFRRAHNDSSFQDPP